MADWSPNFVAYERFNSRIENWDFENPRASVVVEVDYKERISFIKDMLNNRRPWPYPPVDAAGDPIDFPNLRCVSAQPTTDRGRYDPTGANQETMAYKNSAYIALEYKPLKGFTYSPTQATQPDFCKDTLYAEEEFDPSMEVLTTESQQFVWLPVKGDGTYDPVRGGTEPAIPWRSMILNRTVSGYKVIPAGILDTWIGKIHDQPYSSDIHAYTFPANTLLFQNPSIKLAYYNLDSVNFTYSINVKLYYQPQGWNKWYRAYHDGVGDASGFYAMALKPPGSGTPQVFEPFESDDMREFIFSLSDRAALCPTPP